MIAALILQVMEGSEEDALKVKNGNYASVYLYSFWISDNLNFLSKFSSTGHDISCRFHPAEELFCE